MHGSIKGHRNIVEKRGATIASDHIIEPPHEEVREQQTYFDAHAKSLQAASIIVHIRQGLSH
jgi:hypothetical protein